MGRRSSLDLQEPEIDIAGALVGVSNDSEDEKSASPATSKPINAFELNGKTDAALLDSNALNEEDDAAFIAAQQSLVKSQNLQTKGKASKKGGGFQVMGLNPNVLKAVTRKGFSVPTPIQRKTIPLILDRQDVVGMARTGSGKTAAFVIPMIERLKSHSVTVGARAIILSPSRELALQTLKAIKEFGRGTDLRSILVVGGDSLEDQFSQISSNPDIIVATPGRFLHLLVEMSLDLSCVRYVVFDEADRLFEMGFATQLHEILHALPPSRQTLLFSATLPQTLVEFARAGLRDPSLVRLDAEQKISPDLQSAFLTLKSAEKEGALLHLLTDVIKMPLGSPGTDGFTANPKKRKREATPSAGIDPPTAHSTIVFAATKHHVEYLTTLLTKTGFSTSYVYGSLDQTARKMQVDKFRAGVTTLLVVTDVAARGIDIPLLANVINYDFPAQPKIFVHRVGRTARAGRRGWSYNLVSDSDLPYLLDLQLFLGKNLVKGRTGYKECAFVEDIVIGTIPRSSLESSSEYVAKLLAEDDDLAALRQVAGKGEKLYLRSRNSASAESVRRAKKLAFDPDLLDSNPIFARTDDEISNLKDEMLIKIGGFRPTETVFEIGRRGAPTEVGVALHKQRKIVSSRRLKSATPMQSRLSDDSTPEPTAPIDAHQDFPAAKEVVGEDMSDGDGLQPSSGVQNDNNNSAANQWQDADNFISYQPRETNAVQDRGYGVESGSYNKSPKSNFVDAARDATMNLAADESRAFGEPSKMRWDKRGKKYVARVNDMDGSKGRKTITGESGQKLSASFRSGRFDAWKKSNRVGRMPRAGEPEKIGSSQHRAATKKYKYYADKTAKQPDKYRDDFYTKSKKLAEKAASGDAQPGARNIRSEVRGTDDVRKQRMLKQRHKDKNARPSKKQKKRA